MITFNVKEIRKDFPVLSQSVHGQDLVYLDSGATALKPKPVIDAIMGYYTNYSASVHRGAHALSQKATDAYEHARDNIARFIHAKLPSEIIFVRGATEAINLVAHGYGFNTFGSGDEIILTQLEHQSNIVPWQIVAEKTGAVLRVVPIDDAGEIDLDTYKKLLSERTKLVAIAHVSNVLGTVLPVKEMIQQARAVGAKVLVDGAQAASHMPVNVQELDCDFYAISGHKLFGPTGIGVLYAKQSLLEEMSPYQTGGSMIQSVTFEKTTYAQAPQKFEAGSPHIAGAIGLSAAIDYLNTIGMDSIVQYEHELLAYAEESLSKIPQVKIFGRAKNKASLVSFSIQGVHPHDAASILDRYGIAMRGGHSCAQPLMKRFQVPALLRASFAFYNTKEDVDALVLGIQKVCEVMRVF